MLQSKGINRNRAHTLGKMFTRFGILSKLFPKWQTFYALFVINVYLNVMYYFNYC